MYEKFVALKQVFSTLINNIQTTNTVNSTISEMDDKLKDLTADHKEWEKKLQETLHTDLANIQQEN